MKRINFTYIVLITLLTSNFAYSQTEKVGIQTQNPQALFHVDGAADNDKLPSVDPAIQVANDVVIDTDGNLGIGTLTPTAKISIVVDPGEIAFRLNDGSQQKGYMLTSDAEGNAYWSPKAFSITEGVLYTTGNSTTSTAKNITVTPLMLEPGKWLIFAKSVATATVNDTAFNYYLSFRDMTVNPDASIQTVTERFEGGASGRVTTPQTTFIIKVSSPGLNPGDDGYLHEIRAYASSSANFNLSGSYGGPRFFAIRLDADSN